MECWNCTRTEGLDRDVCPQCGVKVRPGHEQLPRLREQVRYLLREMDRWDWVGAEKLETLREDYRTRLLRLDKVCAPSWSAEAARATVVVPQPVEPVTPVAEPVATRSPLAAFLEERNIRWFHTLGALLLLSAGISVLRSQWDGAGHNIALVLLLTAPGLCFWGAGRLREALPQSSRLLSLIGGLLLPTALLAVNHFHLLGLNLPERMWACLAFMVSGGVMLLLAWRLQEVTSLYLGMLAVALSSLLLGPLFPGFPWLGGVMLLGVAGLTMVAGQQPGMPFGASLGPLSQALAAVSLLSALPDTMRQDSPMLFGLGAVFFALSGALMRAPLATGASVLTGLVCIALVCVTHHLSLAAAGSLLLLMGLMYVVTAPRMGNLQALSHRVGLGMVGSGLLLAAGDGLRQLVGANDPVSLWTSCLAAAGAAALFAIEGTPVLMVAAGISAVWGWFLGVVLMLHARPEAWPVLLAVAPLGLLLVARFSERHREPLQRVALCVALLPAPLALDLPGDSLRWVLLLTISALVLAGREARPLAAGYGVWAWICWLKALYPPAGAGWYALSLWPLTVTFALFLGLDAWIGVATGLIGVVFAGVAAIDGSTWLASISFALYSGTLAALASRFKPRDVLLQVAALLAPAAVAIHSTPLAMLVAVGLALTRQPAAGRSAMAWSAVLALISGNAPGLNAAMTVAASVLWLSVVPVSCILLMVCLYLNLGELDPHWQAVLLFTMAAVYFTTAWRRQQRDAMLAFWLTSCLAWIVLSRSLGFSTGTALCLTWATSSALGFLIKSLESDTVTLSRLFGGLSVLGALAGGSHGLWLAAAIWALHAVLRKDASAAHASFATAWLAWVQHLSGPAVTELALGPIGVWLLLWGYFGRSARERFVAFGTGLVVLPALIVSIGNHVGIHAVLAGTLALGLVLLGIGTQRRPVLAVSLCGLVGETVVQMVAVASLLPWQVVAGAGGVLLVGMGIVVERQRARLLAAGRRFMDGMSGW